MPDDFTKSNLPPAAFTDDEANPMTFNPTSGINVGDINQQGAAMKELAATAKLLREAIDSLGKRSKEVDKEMNWGGIKKIRSDWNELCQELKDGSIKNVENIRKMKEEMEKEMKEWGVPLKPDSTWFTDAQAKATSAMNYVSSSGAELAGMAMPVELAWAGPIGLMLGLAVMAKNMYRAEAGKTNLEIARMTRDSRESVDVYKEEIKGLGLHWENVLSNESLQRIKTISDVLLGPRRERTPLVDSLVTLDTVIGEQLGGTMEIARQKGIMFNQNMQENADSANRFAHELATVTQGTDIWGRQVYELYGRLGALAPEVDQLFTSMRSIGGVSGMGAQQAALAVEGIYQSLQGASIPALANLGQFVFRGDSTDLAWKMKQLAQGLTVEGKTLQSGLPDMLTGIMNQVGAFKPGGDTQAKMGMMLGAFKQFGINLSDMSMIGIGNLLTEAGKQAGPGGDIQGAFKQLFLGSKASGDFSEDIKKAIGEVPPPWKQALKDAMIGILEAINGAVDMLLGGVFWAVGAMKGDKAYSEAASMAFSQGLSHFKTSGASFKLAAGKGFEAAPGSDMILFLNKLLGEEDNKNKKEAVYNPPHPNPKLSEPRYVLENIRYALRQREAQQATNQGVTVDPSGGIHLDVTVPSDALMMAWAMGVKKQEGNAGDISGGKK